MSRKNSAPTHGWIISSTITKWVTIFAFILFLFSLLVVMQIRYGIERDCDNPYWRELRIGHYWININAGSTDPGCKQP